METNQTNNFVIENGVLKKYTGSGGDVVIPSGVTTIGNFAFENCINLMSVIIPEGVTAIGGFAFSKCSSLTAASLPDSLIKVESFAFDSCSSLASITIPAGVTEIERRSFGDCLSLETVTILGNVKKFDESAFLDSSPRVFIKEVLGLPSNIRNLAIMGFLSCYEKGNIVIQDAEEYKKYIKRYYKQWIKEAEIDPLLLFSYLTAEKLIPAKDIDQYISPKTPTAIKKLLKTYKEQIMTSDMARTIENAKQRKAARDADGRFLTIADAKSEWDFFKAQDGTYVIHKYKGKKADVIIPTTIGKIQVSKINRPAFENNTKLTSVILPENLTVIDSWAFGGCNKLTNISIPDSVTEVGVNAFNGCKKAYETENGVSYIGAWAVACDSSAKEIVLRAGTKGISDSSFSRCDKLTSVVVPQGVLYIGQYAFNNCNQLTHVHIPDSVVYIDDMTFGEVQFLEWCPNNSVTIHAPAGSYAEQYAKVKGIKFVCDSNQ